jgi:KaiC/GvpD/RAD55 family RecA-like ATPase
MVLSELIKRSPVRIFEQSIRGGLKAGEIGIIASQTGVGKTSVLVQLALDKLLQGKKVIHVSFTQHTHNVLGWYENIFNEFINRKNLENAAEIKNELVKNRVLMNFNQNGMSNDQVLKSLRAMIVEGGFFAEAVIIDGFDFSRTEAGSIARVKAFAAELGLSVWYSCTVKSDGMQYDERNIPLVLKDFAGLIDVVIVLEPKTNHVEFSVCKNHDSCGTKSAAMQLDPKPLLILEA